MKDALPACHAQQDVSWESLRVLLHIFIRQKKNEKTKSGEKTTRTSPGICHIKDVQAL